MKYVPAIILLLALAFSYSCGGGDGYREAVLTQRGFDFSEGIEPEDILDIDGDIVNFAPPPTVSDKSYGDYLWFRPETNTSTENFTKGMGPVSLDSVREAPGAWDSGPGQNLEPLVLNHVYVVKCIDGHVKFAVRDINPILREVEVEYYHTSGTTFDR